MDTTPPRRTVPAAPVSPGTFAHVVLRTGEPERLRDWYQTVLNAEVVFEGHGLCFLTYDEEHHRIAIRHVPGLRPVPPADRTVAHIAYTYRTLGDLLGTYRRLAKAGIHPYWPIRHGPTVSLYYRDPDGLAVELQVDVFHTKAEASAFFHGPDFAANPIGVTFDPEELLRDYEAGLPEEALLQRPDLPAGKTPVDMLPA
ncbi:VOC family protein [Muricoccus aerilatus]|uniref:VOC family protein n=1 Tax=Muricoccus aerilatus TaxID=452982 RepID=UPI000694DCA0|nr:VOC family protein [Roseomonas aerilata]